MTISRKDKATRRDQSNRYYKDKDTGAPEDLEVLEDVADGKGGKGDVRAEPLRGPPELMAGQRAPEEPAVAVAVVMAHRQVPMLVEREPPVQVEELPADQQVLMPVELQVPLQADPQPPVEQVAQEQMVEG